MTKLRKYQEQFERMKRWYELIGRINQGEKINPEEYPGESSTFSIDDYFDRSLDYFYAFFQNCYHLKDWVKKDDAVKLENEEVEDFINKSEYMLICADICNGTKHLEHRNRSHKDPKFGGRRLSMSADSGLIIEAEFSIRTKTGTIDAFELASVCVQEWEKFIKNKVN